MRTRCRRKAAFCSPDDDIYAGEGQDSLFGDTGADRLFGHAGNGNLYYDADGSGSTAAAHVATLTGAATLSAEDILLA